jgi:hypothetical protein
MPAVPAVSSLVRFANGLGEDVSAKFPPAGDERRPLFEEGAAFSFVRASDDHHSDNAVRGTDRCLARARVALARDGQYQP